jgi:[protein-PII] uridylyltransferase
MATALKQRDLIDAAALPVRLDARIGKDTPVPERRAALLEVAREALEAGRDEVRRRFESGDISGIEAVRANAYVMDEVVHFVVETVLKRVYPTAERTESERIALAAIGGYGRGELAPFSDIDLLFLLPYRVTPRVEQIIEYVLYLLWDLKLKVGHATRTVDECIRLARADITIRTATLEARFLTGNRQLFTQLRRRFAKEVVKDTGPQFVEAKLAERDERHRRLGDSRYVLEPNIKDGKGGLRDLQTLFWIAKYLYRVDTVAGLVDKGVITAKEAAVFAKAENFLWTVRCHLHYLTGRGEERLTFDLQPDIGRRLNYKDHAGARGVERFMKHYYLTAKEVGDLTRIFCAALEAEHQRLPRFSLARLDMFRREVAGFRIEGGWLGVPSGKALEADPVSIIRLFHTAQARDLDVHPKALRLITRNLRLVDTIRDDPEANRLFLEMLTSPKGPEIALRRMNEAGVFGRFVPDFGRVVAQMQHDMYHVFTVDEHTIIALGILHRIEKGEYSEDMPASSEAVRHILSRRALYVALLLHDIGKGRGGDHSEIGAEIALRFGPRVGLTAEETETVSWLVRHHLVMSRTAFHRDLNDPKTINDFAEAVQSLERLRLLLILTVADIRAVGPNVWNAWKATLIRDLYYATEEVLSGGHAPRGRSARIEAARDATRDALAGWTPDKIEAFVDLGYPSYWLSFDAATHAYHAGLVARAGDDPAALVIETRVHSRKDVAEVTIYTGDHPGLFARITGAMAVAGANIVEAKIFTMTNGMALDVFLVQDSDGEAFASERQIARLRRRIEQTLTGRLNPSRELAKKPAIPSRTRVFTVPPRVLISNSASRTHSVIEVNGRDRPGLLHDVTRALTGLGLQISSALVTTYGERAVDVFYVKDAFGMQVTHDGKIATMHATLLEALEDPETRARKVEEKAAAEEKARARAEKEEQVRIAKDKAAKAGAVRTRAGKTGPRPAKRKPAAKPRAPASEGAGGGGAAGATRRPARRSR